MQTFYSTGCTWWSPRAIVTYMNNNITNASGSISSYGFACGYVEQTEGPIHGVWLWQDGCYHVRRYHTSPDHSGYIRETWQTFSRLADARKAYRAEARRVLKGLPFPEDVLV